MLNAFATGHFMPRRPQGGNKACARSGSVTNQAVGYRVHPWQFLTSWPNERTPSSVWEKSD